VEDPHQGCLQGSLVRVSAQRCTQVAVCAAQTLRQKLRSCCAPEAYQANEQSILDHVLTLLATQQILQPYIKLEKYVVHFVLPLTRLTLPNEAGVAIQLQLGFRIESGRLLNAIYFKINELPLK